VSSDYNRPIAVPDGVIEPALEVSNRTKIICYRGDKSACFIYRIHIPMLYLARNNKARYEITVSSGISKDQIGKFKLVILQRQYDLNVLMPVLAMRKAGAKTVYEIDDDLFNVPDWNPSSRVLNTKKVQDGIKHFLANVDAMFVTTDALAAAYRNYCENIYVLPNSIDYEIVFPPGERNTIKPVVCWQGSYTHAKDVAVARAGFERLAKDKDILFKMWCGITNDKQQEFDIPGAEVVPAVSFENFYQMSNQIGMYVGLAPLSTHPFNRGKSNLKFLEYTVYNAVTVASAFGPYRDTIEDGVTGILVSDNRDWYDKVRMVIDDKVLHATLLENAKKFVRENYSIEKNYKLWQTAIEELLGE